MAVPFSRPAYAGRARQTRAQQQQQQQQQQQNQPQRNPITRFLDGQGGIRLDNLSLTSRIAFYALYEAYRLLVDLTNNQQQVQQQQPHQPQHTVVHTPEQQQQQQEPQVVVLPDLVPEFDSTRSGHRREPRVHRRQEQQQQQPSGDDSDKWNPEHPQPDLIPENDETDFCYSTLPDFVPEQENYQRITREDLERSKIQRSKRVSVSSDYFSLDGSILEEDDQDESFDETDICNDDHDDLEHEDSNSAKCSLVNKGINWHNLGNQLCEIASAFEVHYAPAVMTEQQRQIYQVYRDLKIKSLALSRKDQTMMGLAKSVSRQVLLFTIWTLLKKIM